MPVLMRYWNMPKFKTGIPNAERLHEFSSCAPSPSRLQEVS